MRLICKSENHPRIPEFGDALVTRCARCRKPTCSDCEGTDNGFRDLCDGCWFRLDRQIRAAVKHGDFAGARRIVRTWAARGRYREVLNYYDLDTPESGYAVSLFVPYKEKA